MQSTHQDGIEKTDEAPAPEVDWITQRELAEQLGFSQKTASQLASKGALCVYEHGVVACGGRRYSRALIQRDVQNRWEEAIAKQDEPMSDREKTDRKGVSAS